MTLRGAVGTCASVPVGHYLGGSAGTMTSD